MFADQPNMSVNSGIHAFLHLNCYHQTVNASYNPNIIIYNLMWDCKKADTFNIRKALDLRNWGKYFGQKNVNAQITV